MSKRGPSGVNWKSIRLELAEAPEFPAGSASRAYMLHLPLLEDGTIDEPAFEVNPTIAGFRRFWPNEPDEYGLVVRTERGWALKLQHPTDGREASFEIEIPRLLPGDPVMINKQGLGRWNFRVVDLSLGVHS